MRNPFRTRTQALVADIVCWVSLIGLMCYAYRNVESLVLSGVILAVMAGVTIFAVLYNGSNIKTVVRSKLANIRYRREEAERQAQYAAEQAERDRRDAQYGRELRDLNRRYDRY